jgi:hypothetical protein
MAFFSGWSRPPTMEEYRNGYPNFRPLNESANDNLKFYNNEIKSKPRGATIEEMHKTWASNYELLESHHGYIQWLFPLRENSRFNSDSQVLQPWEMKAIREDKTMQERFRTTLKMMLNFWGAEIIYLDNEQIKVQRCQEWKERLNNTRTYGHNNMRISRMLKCCGELGFERYKMPIVEFFINECFGEHAFLSNCHCVSSCRDYWVETLRDDQEREKMQQLINDLEMGSWEPYTNADTPTLRQSTLDILLLKTEKNEEYSTTVSAVTNEKSVPPLYNDEGDIGRCVYVCWYPSKNHWLKGRIVQVGVVRKYGPEVRQKILFDNGKIGICLLGEEKEYKFMVLTKEDENVDSSMDESSDAYNKITSLKSSTV